MSLARTALKDFTAFVSAAVSSSSVSVDDGSASPEDPSPGDGSRVSIRPLALDRASRSHHAGEVLDLELTVAVSSRGEQALENTETLLTALESAGRYRVAPADHGTAAPGVFSFLVRIPVAVRLDVPVGPPVREPLHLQLGTGRLLHGTVVGPDGTPLASARVRAHASARTAASGPDGRFELLTTHDPTQHFTVEFNGTARRMSAESTDLPVTLRWEPADHERGTS
ncbi:hypothetical protein D477_009895 [Arthrobacter crystallopoietes BAB-32]|uniref:Carboxypeptidase regulatory-like domain-containing protein n=1 Tax=Arthrobacter crystallopoietes BAB-32 TaxID=1246476 RepID=N1V2W3_9MICC|nr:carboxypeptidase regulatory-like domain-containing protein [Arthrobacter crystallopoietes]EMY34402.1 hypothetical protein D477_009895 [Arthrobacter crystallopoietes BAB-32]